MRTPTAVSAVALGWAVAALSPLAAPAPAVADDVFLKNGRTFEGVVADVGDAQVRIHLPGGVISLPRSAVERVDKVETNFSDYLQRKQQIQAKEVHGERSAADWIDLARWARRSGLNDGVREAALQAAAIEPRNPAVAALLHPFGYVFEERQDRWVSYDDAMRMAGMVQEDGRWVTRQEHAERMQAIEEERLRQQAMALAAAQAAAAAGARDTEMALAQQAAAGGGPGYGDGGGYAAAPGLTLGSSYGGFWAPGAYYSPVFGYGLNSFGNRSPHGRHVGLHGHGTPGGTFGGTLPPFRQPGSLLPGRATAHSAGVAHGTAGAGAPRGAGAVGSRH